MDSELALLASTALTTIVPYLAKGGEEIAKSAGKDFWELLKKPFKSDKEKLLVRNLEEKPEDVEAMKRVQYTLEEHLENDSALAAQVRTLLDELPRLTGAINSSMTVGNHSVGVKDVKDSTVIIQR